MWPRRSLPSLPQYSVQGKTNKSRPRSTIFRTQVTRGPDRPAARRQQFGSAHKLPVASGQSIFSSRGKYTNLRHRHFGDFSSFTSLTRCPPVLQYSVQGKTNKPPPRSTVFWTRVTRGPGRPATRRQQFGSAGSQLPVANELSFRGKYTNFAGHRQIWRLLLLHLEARKMVALRSSKSEATAHVDAT